MELTTSERILGLTEPRPLTELEQKAFTKETKYIVKAIGSNNEKIVDGVFVERILSLDAKKQIKNGISTVKASGLEITRIEEPKEVVSEIETAEELPKPKRRKAK
jgi:hypothetical protein